MNKDHIWTFKSAALMSGTIGPLSLEYHVPASQLKVEPEDLLDSRLWLVMKDNGSSYLYAVLVPTSLERYREGRYADDYLLLSNPFFSIRFLPRQEARSSWALPSSFDDSEGIRKCSTSEIATFEEIFSGNQRSIFAAPSSSSLSQIPKTKFEQLEHAVPDQLISTLRSVSFGDVSRSKTFAPSVSAFGGLALAVLAQAQPHIDQKAATVLMASLDPLSSNGGESLKRVKEVTDAASVLPPIIDTFLEDIDPEKISPRTFVARTDSVSTDWLDKTSRAEENHEKILKDIVLHLKEKGFKVMKSRSFDLVAEKSGDKFLFEIKSSTQRNAVAQAEKGIVQLLRYSTALSDNELRSMKLLLLLQDSGVSTIAPHLAKMSQRAGAELWLYDEEAKWPQRVKDVAGNSLPGA